MLGINIYSHPALEQPLRGFNQAYNARRQRVLDGQTPNQVAADHLTAKPKLANPAPHGRAGPCHAAKARLIADRAKEVSQPDPERVGQPSCPAKAQHLGRAVMAIGAQHDLDARPVAADRGGQAVQPAHNLLA